MALAASLLVAVVSAGVLWRETRTLRDELGRLRGWSGPVGYVLLEGSRRGGGEVPRLMIEAAQPYALVAAQFDVPDAATPGDLLVVQVRDRAGTIRWETTIGVAGARTRLARDRALFLQVPTSRLGGGEFELTVSLRTDGREERLLVRQFRIDVGS